MQLTNRTQFPSWLLLSGFLVASLLPGRAAAPDVVDRTTKQVAEFPDEISDVKCSERVTQTKFDKGGHAIYTERSSFDYFVLLQGTGDDLLLNESRLPDKRNQQGNKKNLPMLITNGFSMLMLIFHPYYRNSFEFQAMPDEVDDGHRLAEVHFRHIRGTRTPVALAVRGREFPLEIEGSAWIDPGSWQVAKIKLNLAQDMTDVGLKSLAAEVIYEPLQLPGWKHSDRLPSVATVDVETLRQRWRNVHQFTGYRRFMVDTTSDVAESK